MKLRLARLATIVENAVLCKMRIIDTIPVVVILVCLIHAYNTGRFVKVVGLMLIGAAIAIVGIIVIKVACHFLNK